MTPPLLRTSERKDWRRCPWLWEQTWLASMRPIRPPVWSWFGTAWHVAMETRYPVGRKRGRVNDCIEAFEAAVGDSKGRVYHELDETQEEEFSDALVLGRQMLYGYVEHYGDESEWEVIHTEAPFQIDVPHPTKPGKVVVVYCGTWDLLVWNRRTKEYWLVDHKTAKVMPGSNPRFLELDDQGGSYLWVAREVLLHKGLIKKKDVIEGIIFSYAKKAPPDPRPIGPDGTARNKPQKAHYAEALGHLPEYSPKALLVDLEALAGQAGIQVYGDVSSIQPTPRFLRHETYRTPRQQVAQARRVQDEAGVMDLQRRGKLPIWKNPTKDCGSCALFEACESHERGEDWQAVLAATHRKDDVYADHREDMARAGIELAPKLI